MNCEEQNRLATNAFWNLFERQKASGFNDEEAARRVCCIANARKMELTRKHEAGGISDDEYLDETALAIWVSVRAVSRWDYERNKANEV